MKLASTVLFALILSTSVAFSQKYKKAVITDVVYFRQTNFNVTAAGFPFYFDQKGFISDVLGDIKKYTKEKFGVDTVEYSQPDSIRYYAALYRTKTNEKKEAKELGGKDVLYVSVETHLRGGYEVNGITTYLFITSVKIYTGKGRLYYRFKNTIPFEAYTGEDIAGEAQMGAYDFYAFYLDGIQYAFKGANKREGKRYVAKPMADKYVDFANQSDKFYFTYNGIGYSYGNDFDNLVEVLNFKKNDIVGRYGYFNFSQVFDSDMLTDGFLVTNKFQDKTYKAKLRAGGAYIRTYMNPANNIVVDLMDNNNDTVYSVSSDSKKSITIKTDSTVYNLDFDSKYNCSELYYNDTMIAVTNPLSDRQVILLDNTATEKQLGDMINILFAKDFIDAVENRLYNLFGMDVRMQ